MIALARLKLSHKFFVLGLIALLITALPTALYVQRTWQEIHTAERELLGMGPAVAMQKLVQLTQQHRGLAAGALGGNEVLAGKLPATQEAIQQAIDRVDLGLRQSGASPQLAAAWVERKDRWSALREDVSNKRIESALSTQRHTALIASLMRLTWDEMDEFGVSFDPLMSHHTLISATLIDAPSLTEQLGQLRAQGTGFLAKGSLPPEKRVALVALRHRADEVFSEFMRNLDTAAGASPILRADLNTKSAALKAQIDRTLSIADRGLINATELTLPSSEYFDEFTRTINSIYDFNTVALDKLHVILNAHMSDLRRMAYIVLVSLLLALSAAVALSLTFVRSITRQLGGEPDVAAQLARSVAQGDLSVLIELQPGDSSSLMAQLKEMQTRLLQIVQDIRQNAETVATASTQIAQGNNDLSGRTEQQASALQETAASMEQLSSTVRQTADNANQACQLAAGASAVAVQGGTVVGQVVDTMQGINESSRKIADIISVIDGIAFQTNILALNAAVEAARAGEQGRGFAVVAGEVRSLAQRSAEAAKEIKSLITASVERVEQGSVLVDKAGVTMTEIVSAIERVTSIIQEISAASTEQSAGVSQVGLAVSQMDQATQQNAALVEQSAAAAESLKLQALRLVQTVAVFKLMR